MNLRSTAAVLFTFFLGSAVFAEAAGPTLEERVKQLEIKMGDDKGAGGTGLNVMFDEGLWFKSSDDTFRARVGALGIFHYTSHGKYNEGDGKIDGFTIKQTGIEMYARLWGAFEAYVRPQFSSQTGGTSLFLGWVEFNKWDAFRIRVGQFKEPFSPETLEDVRWQDMPENSLLSLTTPNRDIGAMIYGTPIPQFAYWLGVFNGNGVVGQDANSDKDAALRLAVRPAASAEGEAFKNLTFGVDMTYGKPARNSGAPVSFTTPVTGTTFFDGPGGNIESDQLRFRLGADVTWIWGPFSLKAELAYIKSHHEINDDKTNMRTRAYMIQAGYWLFNSTRLNNKRPVISKPLFKDGGFGDLQVVGRYSRFNVDDNFEEHAGWGGSRNVDEWALCLNYYANNFVRVSLMFVQYHYDEKSSRRFLTTTGSRTMDDENAIIIRAQIDF